MKTKVDPKIRKLLTKVEGKRPLAVIKRILENGSVSTQELEQMGYQHPPRAVRDVRERGVPIETFRVKGKDGKSIAAYRFGDVSKIQEFKLGGRKVFPKAFKKLLYAKQEGRCAICNEAYADIFLQIDHRIPYEYMGDSGSKLNPNDFMLLCASCNTKKNKATETCEQTCFKTGDIKIIRSCFWASPENYSHIWTEPIRRAEIVWKGAEVEIYDALRKQAEKSGESIQSLIKKLLSK